ncbi:MAG: hypothetical protein OER04_07470 [Cyclobacteriaceae bacterium]|nr:hypothetical protein [Cyclobacteriaceae bacterium]
MSIPLVDISALKDTGKDPQNTANHIAEACLEYGFFYIKGHGVSKQLQDRLQTLSWSFFKQDQAAKQLISIKKGGRAWRGYFGVGDELTSGKPDVKEGLYFGQELAADHPLVRARTPMHGANLFPDIPGFRETVMEYMQALTTLGHTLMRGIAISLELPADYFQIRYLKDPLVLFRIFHYPETSENQREQKLWGVGEHTDYGVLTILKQDEVGGLQVKSQDQWIKAPYIPDTFICNIGDMLDRLTGGFYRSTPHRVLNSSSQGRLSFPLFFDPNYHSEVEPVDLSHLSHSAPQSYRRWDGADLQVFTGTYGEYLLQKVAKVFPQLVQEVR